MKYEANMIICRQRLGRRQFNVYENAIPVSAGNPQKLCQNSN